MAKNLIELSPSFIILCAHRCILSLPEVPDLLGPSLSGAASRQRPRAREIALP
jgi:hypothetical protein